MWSTYFLTVPNGFVSYLDGVLVEQKNSGTTALPNIAASVHVGSLSGSSEFAAGTLDEIRIWNVARSQAQIQANMRLEVDPASTGLLAYYRCNQGIAEANNAGQTTLADLTLTGAHGTLQNFALTGSTSNWVSAAVLGVTSSAVYTLDTTPTWLWSRGPHGVGAFCYQLDSQSGGWTSTPDTNWTPLSPLSAGEHTLYVQEQDWSGTWSPSGSFRVIVFSGIVRVTPAGAGAFDGSSWANALPGATLKAALDGVLAGIEFWVAAGTYTPAAAGGSRSASFVLKNGAALYGGFAGTETARAQRDWAANLTRLSGDLNGNDSGFTNNGENSNHVVTGATGATIDGFTISGGMGTGGGMYNNSASPSVANCSISGNYSTGAGGGMYNLTSSPTITNCTFSGNYSSSDGGAIYNNSSPATITNCTFSGNRSSIDGGAIYNNSSPTTISGCTFSNNISSDDGGGIYTRAAAATVTNCTFNNNRSNDDGGAIYVDGVGAPVVANCLFIDNSSGYWGGAICTLSTGAFSVTNCTFSGHTASVAGATVRHLGGVSTLTNCIVWGSAAPAQIVDVSGGKLAVTYCCVVGSYTGTGNTASDPLFVNAAAGDFHLQPGSPCLDSGTGTGAPATDKDGNGRYDVRAMTNGAGTPDYVDRGAFEAQGLLSWSINLNTGILALTFSCVADGASLVAGGLVIQDAATATKSYRLTNIGAVPLDGTTLSLVLSAQDLNALKATPGLAKDLATAWLRLDADSVHASAGPAMMPSSDGYALQASSFTGDSGRPTLTALTSTTPDGAYAAGATINVTVNFSEPVVLAGGTLNVTLDTGAVVSITAFGPATSASASYTVAAGQNSAGLTATAVALGAGATLTDTSSLVIVTPIPLPATNIATGSAVIIDTIAPNAPVLSGSTPTNDTRPVWTWTSSGGGGNGLFRCRLDNADLASGATQTILQAFVTPDALANGPHILYVQECDDAGNWSDSGSFVLVVDSTAPVITLSDLSQTYDGSAKPVTAVVQGETLPITITYNGSRSAPSNAGTYGVVASATDAAGNTGTAKEDLVIAKAAASVALSGLSAIYDGTAKSATATTDPAGLNVNITYDGLAAVPASVGRYSVLATISDANYSGAAVGTLAIDAPPTLDSLPTATPNPALAGWPISFAVGASDAENDPLTFAWDFGDGSAASSEQNPSHTFSAAGNYTVTLTVSDGKGATTSSSVALVIAIPGGAASGQADSDGDGYSDTIEAAMGSNPNNAADKPAGLATVTQTMALPVSKVALKLNTTPSADALRISGSVLVNEGMTIAGQTLVLDFGGIVKSFTLDRKGGTRKGSDSMKMKLRTGTLGTPLQVASFTAVCLSGSFSSALADDQVTAGAAKGAKASVPVTVVFNGISFQKMVPLTSTGKLWQLAKKK